MGAGARVQDRLRVCSAIGTHARYAGRLSSDRTRAWAEIADKRPESDDISNVQTRRIYRTSTGEPYADQLISDREKHERPLLLQEHTAFLGVQIALVSR